MVSISPLAFFHASPEASWLITGYALYYTYPRTWSLMWNYCTMMNASFWLEVHRPQGHQLTSSTDRSVSSRTPFSILLPSLTLLSVDLTRSKWLAMRYLSQGRRPTNVTMCCLSDQSVPWNQQLKEAAIHSLWFRRYSNKVSYERRKRLNKSITVFSKCLQYITNNYICSTYKRYYLVNVHKLCVVSLEPTDRMSAYNPDSY